MTNRPVVANDPTGHMVETDSDAGSCDEDCLENLRKRDEEKKKRKPGEPRCKANYCDDLEEIISGIATGLDFIGASVSLLEALAATDAYITAGAACIASEFVGCGPAFALAFTADVGATVIFGSVENGVAMVSLGFTALNDILLGNTGYDPEIGPYIGKDTVVAGRNTLAGFIPESYIDLAVSISQVKYDLDRAGGNKSGGYVPVFDPSPYHQVPLLSKDFLSQVFLKDWW